MEPDIREATTKPMRGAGLYQEAQARPEQGTSPGTITELLFEWTQGKPHALEKLVPLVYEKLKQVAGRYLSNESPGYTLQATALVNETYLELLSCKKMSFRNRQQFYLLAGRIMRHILVRHARRRLALKRGSGGPVAPFDEKIGISGGYELDLSDLLALDEALVQLEELDPRQSQIVQLRFFAGMSDREITELLGISRRTVQREWYTAKLWLCRMLGGKLERPRAR